MKNELVVVSAASIERADETYRFSSDHNLEKLADSIRQVGLVNPLLVQQISEGSYRIVCGFRRLAALETLHAEDFPAFVIRDAKPSIELFMLAVAENQSVRPLNPLEVSRILHKLAAEFAVTPEEMVEVYLPRLGYGRNPRVLTLYAGLHTLPPEWQTAIVDDLIPLDFAQEMLKRTEQERASILELIRTLRLGKNRQREFAGLLFDVARMQQVTLTQLVDSEAVNSVLTAAKLTPSQKAELFKQWLWEQRYPRYSETKARFDGIIQRAKLSPNISLQAPPYFEGEKFSLTFSFVSEKSYKTTIELLSAIYERGLVQELADIL